MNRVSCVSATDSRVLKLLNSAIRPGIEEMSTQLHLLADGIEIRRKLSAILAGAASTVCIVMYIFSADESGRAVLSELIHAAQSGVSVRVIVDGFGSASTPDRFFAPLRDAGGQVQWFNTRWHPRYLFRNHQKFVIADGRTAIIGGFNIGAAYFGDGVESGWRETGIAVEGPSVKELQDYFEELWEALARGTVRLRDLTDWSGKARHPDKNVEWVISGPGLGRSLYGNYLRKDLIRASRLSVMMGYFVPSASLRRTIGRIARRGRVELVLPQTTDFPISRYAAWFTFGRLLRDGCEIHEYRPRPLHAKLIVADDIVYAGSANLDFRSLHLNFEMSVRVRDAVLAIDARQLIQKDIGLSRRITQEIYDQNSGIFQRLIRSASYALLRFDYFLSRKFLD